MFWMLRLFCCLCRNRQILNRGRDYYQYYWDDEGDEESDEDEYTERERQALLLNLFNLKHNAIDATTDVIVADELLRRHGDDSSLLMYHDRCSAEMRRALDKLPLTSHGTQVRMPHGPLRSSASYIRDVV